VIVAGSAGNGAAQAALGAALALSAREFLQDVNNGVGRNLGRSSDGSSQPLLLSSQPVIALLASTDEFTNSYEEEWETTLGDSGAISSAMFVQNADGGYPSIEQYEDAVRQFDIDAKPILHVILEGAAAARPLLSPSITSNVSFLGIEPIVPKQARKMEKVLPEVAHVCGYMLQEIVDAFGGRESQPSMAIMLDLPLHLSMLQANSLPKSMSAHGDSFLCRDTKSAGRFVLVNYQYDYKDPFGGTDPLRCPTREITISAAGNVGVGTGNSGCASAAAYTALRGNGVPALPATCIASSVQAVMDEAECLPRHDTSVIEQIATLAEEVKSAAIEQPVLRKRYIEFGYK